WVGAAADSGAVAAGLTDVWADAGPAEKRNSDIKIKRAMLVGIFGTPRVEEGSQELANLTKRRRQHISTRPPRQGLPCSPRKTRPKNSFTCTGTGDRVRNVRNLF